MNSWLTTGQMIDRLKVGEVAERDDKKYTAKWDLSIEGLAFTHKGNDGDGYLVELEDQKRKWRILPKYVPFSEAMKAVEEGKNAVCYFNDDVITIVSYNNKINSICKGSSCQSGGGASLLIAWIVAGKWGIEEAK